MDDYRMDDQDRMLKALFAAPPLADNGFSAGVARRIRRRVLLQRMVLPIAAAVGGMVAFAPAMRLLAEWSGKLPVVLDVIAKAAPSLLNSTLAAALPLAVAMVVLRLIEE